MIQNFIIEAFNRLRTKSPKFFFILQIIGASLLLAGKIPWALERWTNIQASQHFINFCLDVSKYATGFLVSALFTIKTPAVAQTQFGEPISMANKDKLPFTTKIDEKEVAEARSYLPIIPDYKLDKD